MYLNHFGLKQYPFTLTPDTEFFLDYGAFREGLDALNCALFSGEALIKLTGEAGTGKTLLCRQLQCSLDDRFVIAHIPNPSMNPLSLHKALATEIGVKYRSNMGVPQLLKLINDQLVSLHAQGKEVVLLVDEAQALPNESLESIRLLSNLETEKKKLLQIVLFGQPELNDRLQNDDLRQMRQRIHFSHKLKPLSADAQDVYLQHRLHLAGYRGVPLFCAKASRVLYQGSGGVPSLINVLAHKAMLAAYGRGERTIDSQVVHGAISETEGANKPRCAPKSPSSLLMRSINGSSVPATLLSAAIILGASALLQPVQAPVHSASGSTTTRNISLSSDTSDQAADYTTKLILASFVANEGHHPVAVDDSFDSLSPRTADEGAPIESEPTDQAIPNKEVDDIIETLPPLSSEESKSTGRQSRAKWHKVDPALAPLQISKPPIRVSNATEKATIKPERPSSKEPVAKHEVAEDSYIEVKQRPLSLKQQRLHDLSVAANAYKKGNFKEAELLLEKLLSRDNSQHDARLLLARLLAKQGFVRRAELTLSAAILRFPQHIPYVNIYAQILAEDGRHVAAIDTVQRALPDAGDNADLHALLGGLYQRSGKATAAAKSYQKALRLNPKRGEWWMGLGISSEQSGEFANAQIAYNEALKLSLAAQLQQYVEQRLQQLVAKTPVSQHENGH